ncbi:MAG: DUF934 domain-containing protein [Rhizobiales bacterium]|nr:DUF934 domain-containing protein [Hyphomicrobiales bacterium]
MQLIKKGEFVSDSFATVEDDAELPEGSIIVSLERWQAERDSLSERNTPLGVRLKSGQEPSVIADDLDKFAVVALEFPAYRNGRAYSYARLLRERYGYKGEIRAVGNVLRDQFQYMIRVGFDALEVADNITPDIYKRAVGTFTHAYQPGADGSVSVFSLRHR